METTSELAPIDDTRARNRARAEQAAAHLRRLFIAWHRSKALEPAQDVADRGWPQTIARELGDAGLLDFCDLTSVEVLQFLARTGRWTDQMPLTDDPTAMGLSDQDLALADAYDNEQSRRRERESRTVVLDGQPHSAEEADLAALAAVVVRGLTTSFIDTPLKAAPLEVLPEADGTRSPSRGGGGSRRRRDKLSNQQKVAVGLIGEAAVFEWLKHQYPGVVNATAWKSSYRDLVFGGSDGDDDLGFDFEVHAAPRRLLYEVKTTSSDDLFEFDMGESQVRVAQDVANRRSVEYSIVFVRNALDSSIRSLHVLPNPFSAKTGKYFRPVGRGLTYRFSLGLRV